jgi:rod shape-determining protein MreD
MIEYLQVGYAWLVQATWRALPLLVTLVFMLAANLPLHLFPGGAPAPDLALISVFFWAIHGPAFLPAWAVFVIGASQDFSTGTPIGFWILIYLFAYGFTLTQRVFFKGRTGIGVWLGFALVAAITGFLAWLLGMLVFERLLHPGDLIFQGLASLLFYPVFARLFMLVRRSLTTAPEGL